MLPKDHSQHGCFLGAPLRPCSDSSHGGVFAARPSHLSPLCAPLSAPTRKCTWSCTHWTLLQHRSIYLSHGSQMSDGRCFPSQLRFLPALVDLAWQSVRYFSSRLLGNGAVSEMLLFFFSEDCFYADFGIFESNPPL